MELCLQKLELEPIVLRNQPNRGLKTLIEKVEEHAEVAFAVVLLTPDDVGRAKSDTDFKERARQNVLIELGYFLGKLGRRSVCALYKGAIELPSDIEGTGKIEMDNGNEGWRTTN